MGPISNNSNKQQILHTLKTIILEKIDIFVCLRRLVALITLGFRRCSEQDLYLRGLLRSSPLYVSIERSISLNIISSV